MSALRTVLRLAARDARRHRGRSLLLALMILAPVLVVTAGSVLVRSENLEARDEVALRLGADDVQARVEGLPYGVPVQQDTGGSALESPQDVSARLTRTEATRRITAALAGPGDRVVAVSTSERRFVAVGDRRSLTTLMEADPVPGADAGPLRLVGGRSPRSGDEVVVSRALVDDLGLGLGDVVEVAAGRGGVVRPGRRAVVGVVEGAGAGGAVVLGAPGTLLDPVAMETGGTLGRERVLWYVVGPTPVTWPQVQRANAFGAAVTSRVLVTDPPPGLQPAGPGSRTRIPHGPTTGVLVLLALLQVALLAGPSIAVGARRNEHLLATVAASGAEPRQLRAVVLAGAGVVGLVGGGSGALLGLAAGALLVRTAPVWGGPPMPRVDWSPLDPVLLVVVGTATAVAAAVLPARRVGRLDVVAALAGRRPQDRPRLRPGMTGVLVVLVGLLLAWSAALAPPTGWSRTRFLAVLGLAVAEVGLVLSTPAVVSLLARLGRRAPLATRLALRDAARGRSRTAPALAAVLAATAAGSCVLVLLASQADADRRAYRAVLPVGSVSVHASDGRGVAAAPAAVEAAVRDVLPAATTAVLRTSAATDDGTTVPLYLEHPPQGCDGGALGGCDAEMFDVHVVAPSAGVVVAPPEAAVRVTEALRAGKVVVWRRDLVGKDGTVPISGAGPAAADGSPGASSVVRLPAVAVETSQRLSSVLVPDALADRLGPLEVEAVVARPAGPVGRLALLSLQERVEPLGENVAVWQENGPVDRGTRRLVAVLLTGAFLVSLVGTASATALAAADARPDLGTLGAVGADPSLRRRIGAAQAAVVAVPAAGLGVAAGLCAAWLLIRTNQAAAVPGAVAWRFVLPVAPTSVFLAGVPAVAVVLGWAGVRSRLDVVRRPT